MTEEQRNEMALHKPTPAPDDRPVLVRLLASLRFSLGVKLRNGAVIPKVQVQGGVEF